MRNKTLIFKIFIELLAVAFFVSFDLLTKELIYEPILKSGKDFIIIDGVLRFTTGQNPGAAWGMFSNSTLILGIFSIAMSAVMLAVLLSLTNNPHTSIKFALSLTIGGALGNGIDRLTLEHVRDFVYFELIDYPIFNFADSELIIGLILLFIYAIFIYKPANTAPKKAKVNLDVAK
ncbi:MAG: signal peptidase II [Christensenellaceae bacterium]|jgi:signal peptidase II|nr:signal peptidase II [Christensenellaceae bacterium]